MPEITAFMESVLMVGGAFFIGYIFGEAMGAKKTGKGKKILARKFLGLFGR
jgi:hypothetical protein